MKLLCSSPLPVADSAMERECPRSDFADLCQGHFPEKHSSEVMTAPPR